VAPPLRFGEGAKPSLDGVDLFPSGASGATGSGNKIPKRIWLPELRKALKCTPCKEDGRPAETKPLEAIRDGSR